MTWHYAFTNVTAKRVNVLTTRQRVFNATQTILEKILFHFIYFFYDHSKAGDGPHSLLNAYQTHPAYNKPYTTSLLFAYFLVFYSIFFNFVLKFLQPFHYFRLLVWIACVCVCQCQLAFLLVV
jgi:hypothetical protein